MKAQKLFSLDLELIEKLKKEANASQLVNSLLDKYYKENEFEGLSKEEIKKRIEIIHAKQEYLAKIKEIENGNGTGTASEVE